MVPDVAPSTSNSNVIREVHRRRVLAGHSAGMPQTTVETAVFLKYGKEPTINDMHLDGKTMYLASLDDNDLSFMIVYSQDGKRWLIPDHLEYNTYIMVHATSITEYAILGWMPFEEVLEAPRQGDSRVVTPEHFFPMPEEYQFDPTCTELPCNGNAIWDYDTDSWDCFQCGKHRYQSEIYDVEAYLRSGDSVHEDETRLEREGVVSTDR